MAGVDCIKRRGRSGRLTATIRIIPLASCGPLEHLSGVTIGVVISDTFGRAWRIGQTISLSESPASTRSWTIGETRATGKDLVATRICIADELAGAAEMVTGKALAFPPL